jgi:hypothetical protein
MGTDNLDELNVEEGIMWKTDMKKWLFHLAEVKVQ